MAITREDLKEIAPELGAKTDAQLDRAIRFALSQLDPVEWGTLLDEGALYLAAHVASGYGVGGTAGSSTEVVAGPIIRKSIGPVSIQYATSGGSTDATEGGQQKGKGETYWSTFLRLQRSVAGFGMVVL